MAADLTPSQIQQFGSNRRAAGLANNQSNRRYMVGVSQEGQNYAVTQGQLKLSREDMMMNQRLGRDKVPGEYAGRGLLNSGLYQQGLKDFYENAGREQKGQDLQEWSAAQQHNQNLQNMQLQKQEADEAYMAAMVDLNEQEAAQRAELASQLRGVM